MKMQLSLALGAALLASTAMAAGVQNQAPSGNSFALIKLDADQAGKAKVTDPNLVNAWGLCQQPGGPVWVSDNGTNLSTVYNRTNGQIQALVVNIPLGAPTGCVYYNGSGFKVTENGQSGTSNFMFDTESGAIEGWSGGVDASNAIIAVDNSASGAVYKGLAIDPGTQQLYAANFSQNKVEVYNSQFQLVNTFTDPSLPKRYAPFNIIDVSGTLYVSFAERDKAHHDEVDGPGLGYVDVFDTSGNLVKQLIAKGQLNAPWGMAIAPTGFGPFAGDLLVGNFGNGWINAFDPNTGAYVDTLWNTKGADLTIQGLWGLDVGPGSNQVSFSAGPKGETHGLIGIISPK
jgi:uncharacterized protein (TIGR03118 family)